MFWVEEMTKLCVTALIFTEYIKGSQDAGKVKVWRKIRQQNINIKEAVNWKSYMALTLQMISDHKNFLQYLQIRFFFVLLF